MSSTSFPLTLPRVEGPAFVLDLATIERGMVAAKASPRRRIIMQIHRSDTEGVQRMLNFMQRGSYARPHCHPAPENIETVAVLKGSVGFSSSGRAVACGPHIASMPETLDHVWWTLREASGTRSSHWPMIP